MKSIMNYLNAKNLSRILPYISIIIIVSGLIENFYYYDFFSINITAYLDFSECLVLFFSDFLIISMVLLAVSALIFLIIESGKSQKARKIKLFILVIFCIFFFYLWMRENNVQPVIVRSHFRGLVYSFFCSLFFITACIESFKISLNNLIELKKIINIQIVCFIFLAISDVGSFDASLKIIRHQDFKVFLKDGSNISSIDSMLYLGRTKKYMFLYSKKDHSKTILPTEEVKKFVFK